MTRFKHLMSHPFIFIDRIRSKSQKKEEEKKGTSCWPDNFPIDDLKICFTDSAQKKTHTHTQ
jgi:hypothetical protein